MLRIYLYGHENSENTRAEGGPIRQNFIVPVRNKDFPARAVPRRESPSYISSFLWAAIHQT
jgi:hypothetical protein